MDVAVVNVVLRSDGWRKRDGGDEEDEYYLSNCEGNSGEKWNRLQHGGCQCHGPGGRG